MLQQLMSHVSSLRKDMIILEKSEFSALKHEYEVCCCIYFAFINGLYIPKNDLIQCEIK